MLIDHLKPCPRCLSRNVHLQPYDFEDNRMYRVYCSDCWTNQGLFDMEEETILSWNNIERKDDLNESRKGRTAN